MCPPECLTNDGPLCDFSDECPFAPKSNVTKHKQETEEHNLDDYIKELQDKIFHCLHIPPSVKDGITATELQKQKEHEFLRYVRSKKMDYETFILERHERNKPVSTTSEALEMIKFASYLMERCKEVIDNLDKKHPHYEELYSIYSLMQDSISKMGEKSYFLIELYKKFKAFNNDNSSKE
jgi:hypothetical protein